MKEKPSLFSRLFKPKYFEEPGLSNPSDAVRQITVHYEPTGSSGIQNYAGYYQEDYLRTLQGKEKADLYDRMKRSDPNLKMLLSAVKNPIKAASWTIDPSDDSDEAKALAEQIEFILFKDMDKSWTMFVHEALSMIEQGYSLFEIVDKVVIDHPKYGHYNGIESLAFRSQRTIERFNLDHASGKLRSVSQYAFGDLQRLVDIPAEFLLPFVMDKEGDNYEGISWLRPCVGPYKRKDAYLKSEAIGLDKYAIPTPILKIAPDKEESPELEVAKEVLRRYVGHEQQYISIPDGWSIDFLKTDFDPMRIRAVIKEDNIEMINGFLANFLSLGQTGSGSYALSYDLSDFFLSSIEHIANMICEEINRCLIPRLVKLNHGPQDAYPKLRASGITDKAGKELAEVIKLLTDSKAIVPDDALETDLRLRYNLPEKSDQGQRQADAAQAPAQANLPMSEVIATTKILKLQEPKKQIKADQEVLLELMQGNLKGISDAMIKQIMSSYRSLPQSQKLDAIKDVSPTGQQAYQAGLLDAFAVISTAAIQQARTEVPKKKDVKFTDKIDSIKLAEFEKLPIEIQKRLKALSQLLVGTQIADLKKTIYFAYQSSVNSTDSESLLESDLNESSATYILGASVQTGAGNVASQIVNESRNAFFLDDEVSDEIESFTFVNGDPISPICQDLAGTVFAKDDPNLDRYWPPLHHNCKSFISPNLVGKKNPPLTQGGLIPSKSSLNKYVTLSEAKGFVTAFVLVSKELAKSTADAQALVADYGVATNTPEELETGYKFENMDASMFVDGSLKSFSPVAGITIYIGILKPQTSDLGQ